MTYILFAILFLPIISAAAITLFTLRRPVISAGISIGACCLTFIFRCSLPSGHLPGTAP